MSEGGSNQQARQQSELLPSHKTAKEFGKVYVRREGDVTNVEFSIWMQDLEGSQAENWQTGVALDASASMKNWYGRNLKGSIPDNARQEYERKGWLTSDTEDGIKVQRFKKRAYEDAIEKGYLSFTENIVEPLAQDFISYLASELDEDGGTTVIYWACGNGDAYEVLGDFQEDECKTLQVAGPTKVSFGQGTQLTPAVRYFVDRFKDAKRGLYVFLTDGKLDDLDELKNYTTQLAQAIAAEKQNFVKCVLIGVGDSIDESQMEELDDLDTGTEVDIWDHKIAAEMRAVTEIIAELVDENRIVAPTATILDDQDQVVCRFADGLPARASFELPSSSKHFVLEVGDHRVTQELS
ncbi:MAG: VWA domain-containing protein [Planctomycetaceae bacterium]|nr:VWA domain-containing protein [Planctomycetaceae bacterium]